MLVCLLYASNIHLVIPALFPDRTKDGFASFRFSQGIFQTMGLLCGAFFSFLLMRIICAVLLLVAIVTFCILDFCVYPIDKKNNKAQK